MKKASKFKRSLLLALACMLVFMSYTPTYAATKTEFNDVARSLLAEYYQPESCLDTCTYNIDNCYTQQAYANKDQLNSIYETAESVTAGASNDEEKVKKIHDWICTNIDYASDTSGYNGYPYSDLANPFTVYKDKQAVCYGFSNLTQMMLQHVDVPCVIVRGNSSSHVWNAVYLNGKWVFTDNTWDENLTRDSSISYRYYLMSNETYDNSYRTEYIENWAGDACYFPVYVTTSYAYHSIILNSKGGKCAAKIPFSENMDKFVIPVPDRAGRTFQRWNNDHNIDGFYYKNFGGWYLSGGVKGTAEDITFTAQYTKVNPDYEVPQNVVGYVGSTLADVALPAGFSWVDGTQELSTLGTFTFKANYTPEDLDDYNVVKNIDITVKVKHADEGVLKAAEAAMQNAETEIGKAGQLHTDTEQLLTDLDNEYRNESYYVESGITSLQDKTKAYQDSVDKANASIAAAEQGYQDLKDKKITQEEANALYEAAKNDINDVDAKEAALKRETKNAPDMLTGFPAIEDLYSSETTLQNQITALEQALVDVESSITGLQMLQEEDPSDEKAAMISDLESYKGQLETARQTAVNDKTTAETSANSISELRESLVTAAGVAEAELGAANTYDMRTRLDQAVYVPTQDPDPTPGTDPDPTPTPTPDPDPTPTPTPTPTPVVKKKLPAVTLTQTSFVYTGKACAPGVSVKGLVKNRDYTARYLNNIYVGTGKVVVTGKGNYTGSVTKTFRIVPPKPAISKISLSGKTTAKIKVKTLPGISKYQVGYKIKGSKKWSYKNLSVKKGIVSLSKLKHKKTYQIKVRAICPNSNQYSVWTGSKTVRTK